MTKGGAYTFGKYARGRSLALEPDELNNGSVTDTKQWCELHRGHCLDVVPVRRVFDAPGRRDEIFLACQRCIRDLKKAKLMEESKYAGLPCAEVAVPRVLSHTSSLHLTPSPQQQSYYEVMLDALQVKYLRALGLRVVPT